MRIAQITDIHIGSARECPYDIDCRLQFNKVLDNVVEDHPDAIVISGDLCFRDPESEAYAWIAQTLKKVAIPVVIMAGNHDSQNIMRKHFEVIYHEESDEIYFSRVWNDKEVFFLDTARGVMSEHQYQWLEKGLRSAHDQVVIFMHHPPAYCGVPHMDMSYAFKEIPRVQELLQSYQIEFRIFCGHYHVEREITFSNLHISITPSTFFQIDATQTEFKIDHSTPGYRMVEISKEGDVRSKCYYV